MKRTEQPEAEAPSEHEIVTDPREWLPAADAATVLGRSERSVQRLAKQQLVKWRQDGRHRVYNAADLRKARTLPATRETFDLDEQVQTTINRRFAQFSPTRRPVPPDPSLRLTTIAQPPDPTLWLTTIAQAFKGLANSDLRTHETPWITLDQAAELSGLARSDLRTLARSGHIQARRSGRRLLFRRHSVLTFEG